MSAKILIVDDHAPNRELIREALSDAAYDISEAVTASEALERLRHQKTDLVITDVRMPGLSGVDLLKRLNKEYPDVVVILMSAFATVAGAVEAMKLGARLSDATSRDRRTAISHPASARSIWCSN